MKLLIVFFALAQSCAGALLDPGVFYSKSLKVCHSDDCFIGTGILPNKSKHVFKIESESKIEVFFLKTNMREIVQIKPKDGDGVIKSSKKTSVTMRPLDIEPQGLYFFSVLNRSYGRHSWALAATRVSNKTCEIICNGKKIKDTDIVCQAKVGTKVKILTDGVKAFSKDCNQEDKTSKYYEVRKDICTVLLGTKKEYCSIYIYGYESIPLVY